MSEPDFLVHAVPDTVGVVVVEDAVSGRELFGWVMETDETITVRAAGDIPLGHKVALRDIESGDSADANGNGIPDECDCWGDLDDDGDIDLSDLSQLLAHYGMASGATYYDGDLDDDGDVDLTDLSTLLGAYGTSCP